MVPYGPAASGTIFPELRSTCPFHGPGDPGCAVSVHHWRVRKHGPGFPLAVARCRVHGRAFTLYPPGWVPYGRLAVAPARLDGGRSEGWEDTLFGLAQQVAAGEPWRWTLGEDHARLGYSFEYALLETCAQVVGLHPAQEVDQRHAIGEVLGLPTTLLVALSQGGAPLYLARARAVAQVLDVLPVRVDWQAVLVAGALAGRWPEPLWLDQKQLVPLAFRGTRTAGPLVGRAGRGRSTTSVRDPPTRPP